MVGKELLEAIVKLEKGYLGKSELGFNESPSAVKPTNR
jgi:hypothetical protein